MSDSTLKTVGSGVLSAVPEVGRNLFQEYIVSRTASVV
jgi:hypothetical protein